MNALKENKCRISVFTGHYGSGKTELAVNYALYLRHSGEEDVTLVDLDVTNPYYRSTDTEDILKINGIKLISPNYANTNIDLPSLPAAVMSAFIGSGKYIFDLGGNDTGATPFGRYRNKVDESEWAWVGSWDAREGIRNQMKLFEKHGHFVGPWKDQPFIHLTHHGDKSDKDDHDLDYLHFLCLVRDAYIELHSYTPFISKIGAGDRHRTCNIQLGRLTL